MVTKFLWVSAAIILFGIVAEANAQYGYGYGRQSRPYYQRPGSGSGFGGYPQNGYQQPQQQQLPPGVSVQEAEWVCKNPKTGDMMIISSEDVPSTNTGNNGQPQQPNYPQPTLPQVNPQPTFPQPTSSYQTQNPQPPSTDAPNTNGENLIDIRAME